MTPEQRVGRLIDLSAEMQDIMYEMSKDKQLQVILATNSLNTGSSLLINDHKQFKALYPQHDVIEFEGNAEYDSKLSIEIDGVQVNCYVEKVKA